MARKSEYAWRAMAVECSWRSAIGSMQEREISSTSPGLNTLIESMPPGFLFFTLRTTRAAHTWASPIRLATSFAKSARKALTCCS